MKKISFKAVLLLAIISGVSVCCFKAGAQGSRPSPPATVTKKVGDANITINYSQPSVKGRKIWGDLVPYNQVWRTGANEATIFKTDKDITIEGKTLPAGNYSLYTKPGENEWEIILNSQTGQWGINDDGSTTDDPSKDVLVTTVMPVKSPSFNEKLIYTIDDDGNVAIAWENLVVSFKVKG